MTTPTAFAQVIAAMQSSLQQAPPVSPNVFRGVALECYARGTASAPVDVTLDALLGDAVARLMADPSLGGLVGFIDPQSVDWDFDVDGAQTACATVVFAVRHATAAGALI